MMRYRSCVPSSTTCSATDRCWRGAFLRRVFWWRHCVDRGTDADVAEAEAAIERLAAAPADEGLVIRDVWLLRLRALLARARGDAAAYAHFRDRYRDMARTLGYEGHAGPPSQTVARPRRSTRRCEKRSPPSPQSWSARSPGTRERSCLPTSRSRSQPVSRCTSAILTARGWQDKTPEHERATASVHAEGDRSLRAQQRTSPGLPASLNNRPRETLGFMKPSEKLAELETNWFHLRSYVHLPLGAC